MHSNIDRTVNSTKLGSKTVFLFRRFADAAGSAANVRYNLILARGFHRILWIGPVDNTFVNSGSGYRLRKMLEDYQSLIRCKNSTGNDGGKLISMAHKPLISRAKVEVQIVDPCTRYRDFRSAPLSAIALL